MKLSKIVDNKILFYSRDREKYGFMSNFYPSTIELDDQLWPDVEHYYIAMKNEDPEYRQQILNAATPGKAKRLGDSRPNASKKSLFNGGKYQLRQDWDKIKLEVMHRAILAKFTQNKELGRSLKATGDAELIEDSPTDYFWGAGADNTGQNWLGKILMQVRSEI